ncbi:MAG: anaerobic C4-dicarboxylate transporter [Saezia sp.]
MFLGMNLFAGAPGLQLAVQMALLLVMIYFGIKRGGIALGLIGGLGTFLLFLLFGATPGKPPIDVMLIILAVILAASTLQAVGGLDYMVQIAEKILRKHPKYISVLAPFVTYFFTMLIGTGHGIYALQPVIFDVAYKTGVRPERAMAGSSVTSQIGITASPLSAAIVGGVAKLSDKAFISGYSHVTVADVLFITIPATFIGVCAVAAFSYFRGKELPADEEFQERMKNSEFRANLEGSGASMLGAKIATTSKVSVGIFMGAILLIILLAMVGDQLVPYIGYKGKLSMNVMLQIVMLACGAFIVFYTNIKSKKISDSTVFNAGMIAVCTIFGIAMMSETVIEANKPYIIETIGAMAKAAPWSFAIAMFAVSVFLKSQGATIAVMVPLGMTLGLPADVIIGAIPACYAYFFFPFYPSDLAAINFDRTGTTHIGKYLINHSFMLPGLIGVGVGCVVARILAGMFISSPEIVRAAAAAATGG